MRRVVGLVVVVVVAVVAWWLWSGQAHDRVSPADGESRQSTVTPGSTRAAGASSADPSSESSTKTRRHRASPEQLARRNAMRQKILDSIHARERAAQERGSSSTSGAPEEPDSLPPAEDELEDPPPPTGGLLDRTGNHSYLVEVMNQDLMPLADECYAMALEEQPELAGLLVVDLDIIGEEEIGGVVESVRPGRDNELVQPDLLECVRESILSTTLPPPPEGGRDAISLSLRLSPDEP